MASSTQYFKTYLKEQRKISNVLSIIGITPEILSRRLKNASQKHHRFTQHAVPTCTRYVAPNERSKDKSRR